MVAATNYSYDANSRLVALTHSDSLSATLAGYTWAYDHAGRLTDFTVAGYSGEDATYTYDDTDQLVGADRDGTANDESYTYDENGNRIGGGYTVGDNNQLISDGTFNYTYNAEGNRLTKTEIATDYVTEYEWDYRNRLTAIIQKDDLGVVLHEVQYTYDIFNHRIVKTIDADGAGIGDPTQEIYLHDGLRQQRGNAGDHILLAFDEEGDLTHRYLHGPSVDQVLAAEEIADPEFEGDVLWALTDHLGSVRDLAEYDDGTDTTTVVNHLTYDAFGNITSETNAAVDFIFGFTGRERDAESDLQFNRARYYDAAIGRWISEDPIGFYAGDSNLARYTSNNPVDLFDPSGTTEIKHEDKVVGNVAVHKFDTVLHGNSYYIARGVSIRLENGTLLANGQTSFEIGKPNNEVPRGAFAKVNGVDAEFRFTPSVEINKRSQIQGTYWEQVFTEKEGKEGSDLKILFDNEPDVDAQSGSNKYGEWAGVFEYLPIKDSPSVNIRLPSIKARSPNNLGHTSVLANLSESSFNKGFEATGWKKRIDNAGVDLSKGEKFVYVFEVNTSLYYCSEYKGRYTWGYTATFSSSAGNYSIDITPSKPVWTPIDDTNPKE